MTSTASNLTDLYKDKGHQYFTGARSDIIALLPRTKHDELTVTNPVAA